MSQFLDIIGHDASIHALNQSVKNNRVSHAYLFEGFDGIGKKRVAKYFATLLTCLEENAPCGHCASCLQNRADTNPDVLYISAEGENSIKIDRIRYANRELFVKPYQSAKKVLIVDDAHLMTEQAQNALLKTLEEPPSYAVIILITSQIHLLLSTILSRVVVLKFQPLEDEQVVSILNSQYPEIEAEALSVISHISGGSVGQAHLFLNTEDIGVLRKESMEQLCQLLIEDSKAGDFSSFIKKRMKNISLIFTFYMTVFRDMLWIKEEFAKDLVNPDFEDEIRKIVFKYSYRRVMKGFEAALVAIREIQGHVTPEIVVQKFMLTLAEAY